MPAADAQPLLAAASTGGLVPVGEVVILAVTGGEFTVPVQLTLDFDVARVAAGRVPSVVVYNDRTGRWIYCLR